MMLHLQTAVSPLENKTELCSAVSSLEIIKHAIFFSALHLRCTRGVRCLRKCLESGAPRPACGTLLLSLCTEDGVLEVVVEVLGRWAGGRA